MQLSAIRSSISVNTLLRMTLLYTFHRRQPCIGVGKCLHAG